MLHNQKVQYSYDKKTKPMQSINNTQQRYSPLSNYVKN